MVAESFYDSMPVKIQTTSNLIRDMVNITITIKPIMMLPSSSILIGYTNKIIFSTVSSFI